VEFDRVTDAEIAVVSDTHVPSREPEIPAWVKTRLREADHTIHAGDFDSPAAHETVRDLAGPDLTAVAGNTDPASLDLPEVATVEIAGVAFGVTHGTGSLEGYPERVRETLRREAPDATVGVSGHTHEVMDETVDGLRLLNPGSATGATPAAAATMLTVAVEDGSVAVEVHEG
jgi:putative phosphoesterase